MTWLRLKRAVIAALQASVFAVGFSLAAKAEPVTLKIGTSDIYGVASTFVANGDDKTETAVFETARFTGGVPDMLAALRAGQLDIAEVGAAGPLIAQAAGTKFKIVAVTQPWAKGEAIIVAQDSPIKTIEDLKGKKVAYWRATNSQWLVMNALKSKGMTLKDIEPTFLPLGTNLLSALKAGSIDATAFIDVPLANYEAQGARRITDHGELGYPIALQFLASDDAIASKKAIVAAYVRQLAKHLAWANANPQARADAIAKVLRLDPAVVLTAEKRRPAGLRAIDDVIIKSNQEMADAFFEEGAIPKKLDVASTFTTEFNDYIKP